MITLLANSPFGLSAGALAFVLLAVFGVFILGGLGLSAWLLGRAAEDLKRWWKE